MNKLDMQALLAVGVLPSQLQKAAVWIELLQIEERIERRVACRVDRALNEENPFDGLEQPKGKKLVRVLPD